MHFKYLISGFSDRGRRDDLGRKFINWESSKKELEKCLGSLVVVLMAAI